MTVRELIEALSRLDPGAQVVVCRFPGGDNGFSPLTDAVPGWYVPDHTWDGEFYDPGEAPPGTQPPAGNESAVALYPTY